MVNVLGLAGIGVSALSLLFGILALALTLWESAEILGLKVTRGLWEICVESVCVKFADLDNLDEEESYNAIKAMLFVAIFLLLGAIFCTIVKMFLAKAIKEEMIKNMMSFTAGGIALVAGACMLISFRVYDRNIAIKSTYDYDAGFVLNIVGGVLALIAGGLIIGSNFEGKKSVGHGDT